MLWKNSAEDFERSGNYLKNSSQIQSKSGEDVCFVILEMANSLFLEHRVKDAIFLTYFTLYCLGTSRTVTGGHVLCARSYILNRIFPTSRGSHLPGFFRIFILY